MTISGGLCLAGMDLGWAAPSMSCVSCASFFVGFKGIQLGIFFGWCYSYGEGSLTPLTNGLLWLSIGAALVITGQVLNLSVFFRLGQVGVFYGTRFGYDVPWCRAFPFSILRHTGSTSVPCSPSGASSSRGDRHCSSSRLAKIVPKLSNFLVDARC